MTIASKLLAGLLVLAGATLSVEAGAVVPGGFRLLGMQQSDRLLEPARWERRCHRELLASRDRFGRRIEVPRRVCGRVWMGPRRY